MVNVLIYLIGVGLTCWILCGMEIELSKDRKVNTELIMACIVLWPLAWIKFSVHILKWIYRSILLIIKY